MVSINVAGVYPRGYHGNIVHTPMGIHNSDEEQPLMDATDATSSFTMSRTFNAGFAATVGATRAALADQGFGIITEIDMAATLRAKLGVKTPNQVILGACRPELAHRATQVAPSIATVLPCNVVVRASGDTEGTCLVEMFDPSTMARLSTDPGLDEVAAEARNRLAAALHAIDPTVGL